MTGYGMPPGIGPFGPVGASQLPPSIAWPIVAAVGLVVLAALFLASRDGGLRAGLLFGLRGLVGKEMRTRNRGWRPMLVLTGYLLGLGGAVVGFLYLAARVAGTIPPTIGTQLFAALSLGAVVLLGFITPALTAAAVSGERERRTLDLLLVTRASALGLVSGKLLGSLVYIVFLLVASLPAFALVYLYGGVPLVNLAMVLAVAAVTALAHAALALMFSALFRRTLVALVLSYVVVLTLVLALPFVAAVLGVASAMRGGEAPVEAGGGDRVVRVVLYASPLTSLASVLPLETGPSDPIGAVLQASLGQRGPAPVQPPGGSIAHRIYVTGWNPSTSQFQTGLGWAPWVFHFALMAAFVPLSLAVSALAVMPVKPWRAWLARRRAVGAAAAAT